MYESCRVPIVPVSSYVYLFHSSREFNYLLSKFDAMIPKNTEPVFSILLRKSVTVFSSVCETVLETNTCNQILDASTYITTPCIPGLILTTANQVAWVLRTTGGFVQVSISPSTPIICETAGVWHQISFVEYWVESTRRSC